MGLARSDLESFPVVWLQRNIHNYGVRVPGWWVGVYILDRAYNGFWLCLLGRVYACTKKLQKTVDYKYV